MGHFGNSDGSDRPHVHGCSIGYNVNDYQFATDGGTEDGYAAIELANVDFTGRTEINGTDLTSCDSLNKYMILVTDEDRDSDFAPSLVFDAVSDILKNGDWNLHAILNTGILPSSPSTWTELRYITVANFLRQLLHWELSGMEMARSRH